MAAGRDPQRWTGRASGRGRSIIVLAAALIATSCSPNAEVPTSTTSTTVAAATTTVPGDDPCTVGDLPFVTDGLVAAAGEASGDATAISQIRWEPGSTCERIVVSFATETGAPATSLGPTGVTSFAFTGLIRVALPASIVRTAVADMVTDGRLLSRTYVIRNEADAMAIDLHGADGVPLAARAFVTSSPAALVIDLVSAPNSPPPSGAEIANSTVVVTPSAGPSLYPFIVSAYVQPGLRTVRLQLANGDQVSLDRAISLDGFTDAWQGFESRIEDGPSGTSILFVGQVDANGRPLDGASVSLDLP